MATKLQIASRGRHGMSTRSDDPKGDIADRRSQAPDRDHARDPVRSSQDGRTLGTRSAVDSLQSQHL